MKSLYSVPSGKDRLDRNIKQMKTIKMVRRKELNQIYLLWTLKSKLKGRRWRSWRIWSWPDLLHEDEMFSGLEPETWWCQHIQWLNLTSSKKRGKPNPLSVAKEWRESQKTWAKHRWTLCCSLRAWITRKTVFSAKNSISKPTESSGWLQAAKKA